jgi:rhomboid protease GluP
LHWEAAPGRPWVSYTLLGVTVSVFALQLLTETLLGVDLPRLVGIKSNELIAQGQLWRLLTPMLLHGSLLHIVFNMYALSVIGPGLEAAFGHGRFLALYLLGGFAGNVVSMTFTLQPSLGSSTAIFGLLAAQGVYIYQNRQLFGGAARRALINLLTIAGINFFIGLSPGIDNWGHLGGFLGGGLFTWLAGPLLEVQGVYPDLALADRRGQPALLRAALLVAGIFALLAALVLWVRAGAYS